MSRLDHRLDTAGPVRRLEVISGAMGRRRWSADDRARIVEETLVPGAVVSVVARRHGLTPQHLFAWRRQARKSAATLPVFVPAVMVPEPTAATPPAMRRRQRATRAVSRRRVAMIAIDVAGVKVTIENGASAATIAAVIGALKSGA